MIDSSFRARLKAGAPLIGAFVNIESPTVVEVLAVAGMDFLMIDGEHAPIGPAGAVEMIRAAEARRIPILARVGENTQQVMAKYLDAGVIGTMTPMVSSTAEAERVVDSVKYPPMGKRGLAGSASTISRLPPATWLRRTRPPSSWCRSKPAPASSGPTRSSPLTGST
ncbi:MAG: hypothetical protein F4029_13715 [Gammaproteobacteria bacterium]|nr:hypothetical protein [Gammaproteobacteria bacterium]MYK47275.1 hypothetical protein [Gammaproteobacteria bacterium]